MILPFPFFSIAQHFPLLVFFLSSLANVPFIFLCNLKYSHFLSFSFFFYFYAIFSQQSVHHGFRARSAVTFLLFFQHLTNWRVRCILYQREVQRVVFCEISAGIPGRRDERNCCGDLGLDIKTKAAGRRSCICCSTNPVLFEFAAQ